MPVFRYVAVEPSAAKIEGRMEAASKSAVVERLHAAGHVPIRIDEVGRGGIASVDLAEIFARRGLSPRGLALMTGQLATLLHAGLALDDALAILTDLVERRREQQVLSALLGKIRGGATLADAMAAEQGAFPDFYISMVRAGEAGASLETVLARLAEYLERSQAAREHIRSALMYPMIVALVCCASIGILFAFVVPKFRPLFEQAGTSLPAPAQMLLAASDAFQSFWYLLLLVPLAIAGLVRLQLRNPAARQRWQELVLRLPLFGDLARKIEVVRFSRTLGTLLKNGVSMLSALAITRETLRNAAFRRAMETVMDLVKTGKGLAEPLAQTKVFPRLAVHLIRVGEESGHQEEMLLKIADIFETETRRSIDRMLTLLTPALTIGLGVVVAGVIGSILSAVLSVYDLAM